MFFFDFLEIKIISILECLVNSFIIDFLSYFYFIIFIPSLNIKFLLDFIITIIY